MPTKLISKPTIFLLFLLLIFLFISPSLGKKHFKNHKRRFNSPDFACDNTPHPGFCKNVIPRNMPGTINDYGKYSIRQSFSESKRFLSFVRNQLKKGGNSIAKSTMHATEDCNLLAELNQDFFFNTYGAINSSNNTDLEDNKVDDLDTLLSAILTNQQTCLDGLEVSESWSSVKNDFIGPVSKGLDLHSVSLALFTHGWARGRKDRARWLTEAEKKPMFSTSAEEKGNNHGELPLRVEGRKLLQVAGENVIVSQTVIVNPDGSGNFTTINDAVAAAPDNSVLNGYFVIRVVAGVYEEYVNVPKSKISVMMIGDGINQTIITGDRSVADGWTTFNSATFTVTGPRFVGVNLTIRNTAGAIKHQAVALRNNADLSTFYKCSFEGYQDTLYAHSLRQFYRECDVYGTVDFIFGNAAVVLQNCNIYPRLPMEKQFNAITAQGRIDPNQNTGTSIQNCTIRAADDLASSNGTTKTYLGRPWKAYSRTVFMQSFIDSMIEPAGWREWSGDFALSTLHYAEYANRGPGSNTTGRVTWPGYNVINETDASTFTVSSLIRGLFWLPPTGVPFTLDLH